MSGLAPPSAADVIDAVRRMRSAQKAYFLTRDNRALHSARDLERLVDRMLDQIPGTEPAQTDLFAGGR